MQVLNYGEGLRPLHVPMISEVVIQRCAVSTRKTPL
jgi:hypothetical protein